MFHAGPSGVFKGPFRMNRDGKYGFVVPWCPQQPNDKHTNTQHTPPRPDPIQPNPALTLKLISLPRRTPAAFEVSCLYVSSLIRRFKNGGSRQFKFQIFLFLRVCPSVKGRATAVCLSVHHRCFCCAPHSFSPRPASREPSKAASARALLWGVGARSDRVSTVGATCV